MVALPSMRLLCLYAAAFTAAALVRPNSTEARPSETPNETPNETPYERPSELQAATENATRAAPQRFLQQLESGRPQSVYSPPPCGNYRGYGQVLYSEDAGSICVPTCPMVGVYREVCPSLGSGPRPHCEQMEQGPLCLFSCKSGQGCPSGMSCGGNGFCVFPKKSCLADPVLGVWKVQNAFGIKGVTVSLKVLPAADTSADTCGDPTATIEYIGTKLHYKVSVKQTIPGQLHVRFFNKDGQSPAFTPYYHEGYYLGSSDVLLEDLNFKNGEKSPDTSGVLLYRRSD